VRNAGENAVFGSGFTDGSRGVANSFSIADGVRSVSCVVIGRVWWMGDLRSAKAAGSETRAERVETRAERATIVNNRAKKSPDSWLTPFEMGRAVLNLEKGRNLNVLAVA